MHHRSNDELKRVFVFCPPGGDEVLSFSCGEVFDVHPSETLDQLKDKFREAFGLHTVEDVYIIIGTHKAIIKNPKHIRDNDKLWIKRVPQRSESIHNGCFEAKQLSFELLSPATTTATGSTVATVAAAAAAAAAAADALSLPLGGGGGGGGDSKNEIVDVSGSDSGSGSGSGGGGCDSVAAPSEGTSLEQEEGGSSAINNLDHEGGDAYLRSAFSIRDPKFNLSNPEEQEADAELLAGGMDMPFRYNSTEWKKTPKSCLQEWCQKTKSLSGWSTLRSGPDKYLMRVFLGEKGCPYPNFFSVHQRDAEHNAALCALLHALNLDNRKNPVTVAEFQHILFPMLAKKPKPKSSRKDVSLSQLSSAGGPSPPPPTTSAVGYGYPTINETITQRQRKRPRYIGRPPGNVPPPPPPQAYGMGMDGAASSGYIGYAPMYTTGNEYATHLGYGPQPTGLPIYGQPSNSSSPINHSANANTTGMLGGPTSYHYY